MNRDQVLKMKEARGVEDDFVGGERGEKGDGRRELNKRVHAMWYMYAPGRALQTPHLCAAAASYHPIDSDAPR